MNGGVKEARKGRRRKETRKKHEKQNEYSKKYRSKKRRKGVLKRPPGNKGRDRSEISKPDSKM